MDVSIIIVSYNTQNLIIDCLNSIFKQTKNITFEVIVIDNASSDNSINEIKHKFTQVNVISSEKNIGFGQANNIGSKRAIGKYLFFLNSDTKLLNNATLFFYNFMERNNQYNNIGAVGCILLDKYFNPTHSSGTFPKMRRIIKDTLGGYFIQSYYQSLSKKERRNFNKEPYYNVEYITGADLFISKETFNKYKGFDASFFMYYEETDLQKQMDKDGLCRLLIPGPQIIHLEGKSFSSDVRIYSKILNTKGMFIYFKKNSSLLLFILFRILYFIIRLPFVFDKRFSFKEKVLYFKTLSKSVNFQK